MNKNIAQITLWNQRMDKSYGYVTINVTKFEVSATGFVAQAEFDNDDDYSAVVSMLVDSHVNFIKPNDVDNSIEIRGNLRQIIGISWFA